MTIPLLVALGILGTGLALYSSICSVRSRRALDPAPQEPLRTAAAGLDGPHVRQLFLEAKDADLAHVTGLALHEAEELLDWLEANHYMHRELSYVDGEGFAVRYR